MISVIVPVLNEENALPVCLNALNKQKEKFEIIVVDGGSDDTSIDVATKAKVDKVISTGRGRAHQMNAGAHHANGEWLVFLHADTLLPATAFEQISALTEDINIKAGCFNQQFSGQHFLLRAISYLHNWRCNRTRIIYGDQCLFIRRQLFERLDGFPDTPILEDVMLSEMILEHCHPYILSDPVITDSRKFEQRGIIRSFLEIFVIMSCYELGLPIKGQAFFSPVR